MQSATFGKKSEEDFGTAGNLEGVRVKLKRVLGKDKNFFIEWNLNAS